MARNSPRNNRMIIVWVNSAVIWDTSDQRTKADHFSGSWSSSNALRRGAATREYFFASALGEPDAPRVARADYVSLG